MANNQSKTGRRNHVASSNLFAALVRKWKQQAKICRRTAQLRDETDCPVSAGANRGQANVFESCAIELEEAANESSSVIGTGQGATNATKPK